MADTIAGKAYVNTGVDAINQRILGRYQDGMGKTWDDPHHMKFYGDGSVGYPYLSDGMVPHPAQALGPAQDHPDYLGVARSINRLDIYQQAATAAKAPLPKGEMRSSKLMDGTVWDGKDPRKYADSFAIKA